MKTKLFALVLAAAAGTASAQNAIVSDVAGTFVDISGLGANALINGSTVDDVSFPITTSVTNTVFSSTNVRICSNGFIQFGAATGSTAYTNAAIAAGTASPVAPTTAQTLFPYWDDQYIPAGNGGEIYWMEGPAASFGLPAGRGNVLIIQWNNVPHYDAGNAVGAATYQVQIFQNVVGNVAAQMIYADPSYDDARFDDGASATIGFASGTTGGAASTTNVQYAFNTAGAVQAGSVLSIMIPGTPIPPAISGTATPAAAAPGDVVLYTANVSPGINPASTGIVVRGNLTAVGGAANALFHDDGLNGDASAGDGVYSFSHTIGAATPGGNYTVALTATDLQGRTGNGSISGNIFNPTSLGTLVDNVVTAETVDLAAAEVKWYRATVLDCSAATLRTLTVSTRNSPAAIDTEIGVYSPDGTLIANNDDNPYPYSQLSFGNNGTSGDLAAGLYYFPVSTFNTNFASGFVVTSTGPGGTALLELLQITPTVPTATSSATVDGSSGLLMVTVSPAAIPPSTGIQVHANLTSIGGSANQAFYDDGTHGDASAGDNIFTFAATIPGADGDTYSVPYTVTDAESRSATGTIDFAADVGSMPATAFIPQGTGSLDTINGVFGPNDVDMFKIQICDPSGFSAAIAAAADTQLFLFNPDGTGVTFNDDTAGGGSLITNLFVTNPGDYYIAATRYNTDPIDASGELIWQNTPFAVERAPDGPGAANPLDSWTGATGGTATYTITFTGTCYPTNGPICGPADLGSTGGVAGADGHLDNNDFIVYIDNFFNHLPSADIGTTGGVPGTDGAWDNNDFIVFIDQFFNAPASCR